MDSRGRSPRPGSDDASSLPPPRTQTPNFPDMHAHLPPPTDEDDALVEDRMREWEDLGDGREDRADRSVGGGYHSGDAESARGGEGDGASEGTRDISERGSGSLRRRRGPDGLTTLSSRRTDPSPLSSRSQSSTPGRPSSTRSITRQGEGGVNIRTPQRVEITTTTYERTTIIAPRSSQVARGLLEGLVHLEEDDEPPEPPAPDTETAAEDDATEMWWMFAVVALCLVLIFTLAVAPSGVAGDLRGTLTAAATCAHTTFPPPGNPLHWLLSLLTLTLTLTTTYTLATTLETLTHPHTRARPPRTHTLTRYFMAWCVACAWAFAPITLTHARTPDPHTLDALLVCVCVCVAARTMSHLGGHGAAGGGGGWGGGGNQWKRVWRDVCVYAGIDSAAKRRAATAVVTFGLIFSHPTPITIITALPLVAYVLWVTMQSPARPTRLQLCTYLCVGISPYLLLLLHTLHHPSTHPHTHTHVTWGHLRSPTGFLRHILALDYLRMYPYTLTPRRILQTWRSLAAHVGDGTLVLLGVAGALCAAVGACLGNVCTTQPPPQTPPEGLDALQQLNDMAQEAAQQMQQQQQQEYLQKLGRWSLVASLMLSLLTAALWSMFDADDSRRHVAPALLIFVFVGISLHKALDLVTQRSRARYRWSARAACVLIALVTLYNGLRASGVVGRNVESVIRAYGRALVAPLPENAVVFVDASWRWGILQFVQACNITRPDVTVVNLALVTLPWWPERRRHYPEDLQGLLFPSLSLDQPKEPFAAKTVLKRLTERNVTQNRDFFLAGTCPINRDINGGGRLYLKPFGLVHEVEWVPDGQQVDFPRWRTRNREAWKMVQEELPLSMLPKPKRGAEGAIGTRIREDVLFHIAESAAFMMEMVHDHEKRSGVLGRGRGAMRNEILEAAYWLEVAVAYAGGVIPRATSPPDVRILFNDTDTSRKVKWFDQNSGEWMDWIKKRLVEVARSYLQIPDDVELDDVEAIRRLTRHEPIHRELA